MQTYIDSQLSQVDADVAIAMKDFIDGEVFKPFSLELVNAIIKQMGGVNNFMIEVAETIVDFPSGITPGFVHSNDMQHFCKTNKEHILNILAVKAGGGENSHDVAIDYIASWDGITMQDIDRDTVKATLLFDETDDDDSPIIFSEICFFLIQTLCKSFLGDAC